MPRRMNLEEPVSRLAAWSWRLALFSLPVTLLAVILLRGDLVELVPGLAIFGAALVIALLAVLLALGAFVVIWNHGIKGFARALFAFIIGVALLAYPAYLGFKAYRLPAIADIVTDPYDPPRYEAVARLRTREANPVAYPGPDTAALQRLAYPELTPMILPATPAEAYNAVLDVVTRRKWQIVDARPPQVGRRDGHVEAIARTPLFGLRNDVVIRVRADGNGSRIDMRSSSRYGRHDLGDNATLIRKLGIDIQAAVEAQTTKR
jgi:uncharacterized protein (DUF1499 family)